jgi:hypothetical protein
MARHLRGRRPGHATVVAYLALFIALGGSSYAAVKITGRQVRDSSLTGRDVRNESLTGKDVKGLTLRDFSVPLPAGPKGDTGDQGPPGLQGPQGDPGPGAVDLFMDREAESDSFVRDLTKVGPWKVQTACFTDTNSGSTALFIFVNGPAGDYRFFQGTRDNDSGNFAFESSGNGFSANFPTLVLDAFTDAGFQRVVGTAQIHANSGEAATLEVNGVANDVDSRCSLRGLATPAP